MADSPARARVASAAIGQDIADLCYGLVGDVSTPMSATERIRYVRRIRLRTLALVDAVVMGELAAGATWAEVAEAVGMDLAEAQRVYGPAWAAWLEGDHEVLDVGDRVVGTPGDEDLAGTAQALDQWWRRHAEPWQLVGDDAAPVSRALVDGQASPGDR